MITGRAKHATMTGKVTQMKRPLKLLIISLLTVSTLVPVSGCKKNESTRSETDNNQAVNTDTNNLDDPTETIEKSDEPKLSEIENSKSTDPIKDSYLTFNTDTYSLIIPGARGTVEDSDEPETPEALVYWDPSRALKEEYTMDEAFKKYAIVAGKSTLIYTACDDLRTYHEFYCPDYGYGEFWNFNQAVFLDADGKAIDGRITNAYLKGSDSASLSEFKENLGQLFVDSKLPFRVDPEDLQITIIEDTDDHIFASIIIKSVYRNEENNEEVDYDEALFYAEIISGNVFFTVYENRWLDHEFTDEERQYFTRYSKIYFDHLSPDDKVEPYIYDKLVNTPILGSRHVTSFNNIHEARNGSIQLRAKPESPIYNLHIYIGVKDSNFEKKDGTEWEEKDGIKTRESTDYTYSQEFLFTIDGIRYRATFQNSSENKKTDVESLDALLKLIEDNFYITGS